MTVLWVDLHGRSQGVLPVPRSQRALKLLMLRTHDTHWCGYVESPIEGIPNQETRAELVSVMHDFNHKHAFAPTFWGPSGQYINWVHSASGIIHPDFTSLWWVGWDFNEIHDLDDSKYMTVRSAQTFYAAFWHMNHDEKNSGL
jgi:hypothetical protein